MKGQLLSSVFAFRDHTPLLRELESYVCKETGKIFQESDRKLLERYLFVAIAVYQGQGSTDSPDQRSELYKLRDPLEAVMRILCSEANHSRLFIALGAPEMLTMSPKQEAVARAVERYEVTIEALEDIYFALPSAPSGPGRPSSTKLLQSLVKTLDDYWLQATGRHITQQWEKGEPSTPATQSIHAVVSSVAPSRIGSLKKIIERVIATRNPKKRASG